MMRLVRSAIAAAAVAATLIAADAGPRTAQAESTTAPIELNQSLIDRWLILMPAFGKLMKEGAAQLPEDEGRVQLERICADAGFDNADQCAQVFGYIGMILSACDGPNRRFRDPIILMRQQIAKIEADANLSLEQKDKATAELKEVVARFPNNVPEAHLRLVTANAHRIFKVAKAVYPNLTPRPERRPAP